MSISTEGSGTPTMRPKTDSLRWSGGGRTISMSISTEGSGTPTMRPKTDSLRWGGGGELLTCPYLLKVQARPP